MKLLKSIAAVIGLCMLVLPCVGCGRKVTEASSLASVIMPDGAPAYYEYLGSIDYSTPVAALVWEQVDGEDEGVYGIQYREVTDFNSITSQTDIPVCLYFYSSSARGSQNLSAGVEDLAQTLAGKVLFIAVDGVEADAVSTAYQVGGYPEFILLNDNARISTFSGIEYEEWNIDDVTQWITDNGYEPDLTMLMR